LTFHSNHKYFRPVFPSVTNWVLASLLIFLPLVTLGNAADTSHDVTSEPIDSFPVPSGNPSQLFYLQRTANTNTIICELNADSRGIPKPDKPVNVYWILFSAGGTKKELNYIQRNFAYGIDAKAQGNDTYALNFVSYKKRQFTLKWHAPLKKYQVFVPINNKEAILQRIFIKVSGGSFWVPNIVYVEFKGIDPVTGKEVIERFKP
jgi:hypothetical protein